MTFLELRQNMLAHRTRWCDGDWGLDVSVQMMDAGCFGSPWTLVRWRVSVFLPDGPHFSANASTPEQALANWERVELPKLQVHNSGKLTESPETPEFQDVCGEEITALNTTDN